MYAVEESLVGIEYGSGAALKVVISVPSSDSQSEAHSFFFKQKKPIAWSLSTLCYFSGRLSNIQCKQLFFLFANTFDAAKIPVHSAVFSSDGT